MGEGRKRERILVLEVESMDLEDFFFRCCSSGCLILTHLETSLDFLHLNNN